MAGHEFVVTFEGDEIALDVPEEGSTVEEWTISPMAYPGVRRSLIDCGGPKDHSSQSMTYIYNLPQDS